MPAMVGVHLLQRDSFPKMTSECPDAMYLGLRASHSPLYGVECAGDVCDSVLHLAERGTVTGVNPARRGVDSKAPLIFGEQIPEGMLDP